MRASSSTQAVTLSSGRVPVPSRVEIPATKSSGRTTRTAQKAARPFSLSETESNSPTHPSVASCDVDTSVKEDKGLI